MTTDENLPPDEPHIEDIFDKQQSRLRHPSTVQQIDKRDSEIESIVSQRRLYYDVYGTKNEAVGRRVLRVLPYGVLIALGSRSRAIIPWHQVLTFNYHKDDHILRDV